MNPYDQAHELARALKESEEYREFTRLKEVAYDDGTNKALLDEYKRLQFRLQANTSTGRRIFHSHAYQKIPYSRSSCSVAVL